MTTSNVQVPAVTEYAEMAAERHRAAIEAVPHEDIQYVYADPMTVVPLVLNAEKRYMVYRSRMAALGGEVDLTLVDQCSSYARAYLHCCSRVPEARGEPTFDKAAIYSEALKTRDLFTTVRSGLDKANVTSNSANMRPMAGAVGHLNVAGDLVNHVTYFRARWSEVEGKVPIAFADLERAEAVAMALTSDDAEPEGLAAGSAQLMAYQAGTLFLRAYAEVRRAILFLRARQGDADEIAPPIYSGRTPPKKAPKPAPETQSSPQPATPAQPTAVENIPVGSPYSSPFLRTS